MKNWFTSANGAIALSAISLVSFLGRTLLDAQYVFPEFASTPSLSAVTVGLYSILLGAWLWALLAGARGSRRGLIAVLVMTLLLCIGTALATLISFCPSPCKTAGGLMEIANWSNLATGLIAAVTMGLHLTQHS